MFTLNDIIIKEVTDVFTVFASKDRESKVSDRKTFGLSFCKTGQITYTHDGNSFVADPTHAVFLPKDQTYTLHFDKGGEFPVINFECENFDCPTIQVIPIRDVQPFLKEFEQIKKLSVPEGHRSKIISIFYHILYHLSFYPSLPFPLLSAKDQIEKNYNNPLLTNQEIAKKCNISEVYLRKLFLAYLQTTPKKFILELRLQQAKQLLTEGSIKIGAIAERCGFSNPYHFCRIFKEKTGLTPTEYMKQNVIRKI